MQDVTYKHENLYTIFLEDHPENFILCMQICTNAFH